MRENTMQCCGTDRTINDSRSREIFRALAENGHCRSGLLFSQRIVETEHGVLSADNDREMIVILTPTERYVYGHVLKAKETDGTDAWVALLVPSDQMIDAPDVDTLFKRVHYDFTIALKYYPPIAQEKEDVFAILSSYEEACKALAEMIRRFDPSLREPPIQVPYGPELPDPPGRCDMRLIDIYGLADYKDENGVLPKRP